MSPAPACAHPAGSGAARGGGPPMWPPGACVGGRTVPSAPRHRSAACPCAACGGEESRESD
eukprot:5462206-Alexandrium_andersonii.AAC.1